jgi:hypothetical protein
MLLFLTLSLICASPTSHYVTSELHEVVLAVDSGDGLRSVNAAVLTQNAGRVRRNWNENRDN